MKKFIAIAAAALLAVSLAACGEGDITASNEGTASTPASSAPAVSVNQKEFADTLDGLRAYMIAGGYIEQADNQPEAMQAAFVGAKEGVRYIFGKDGTNNVSVELYAYDLANLNEDGKKALESAKANGTVLVLDKNEIPAVLSDNGKYLMVYRDSVDNDAHKEMQRAAEAAFKQFKA